VSRFSAAPTQQSKTRLYERCGNSRIAFSQYARGNQSLKDDSILNHEQIQGVTVALDNRFCLVFMGVKMVEISTMNKFKALRLF